MDLQILRKCLRMCYCKDSQKPLEKYYPLQSVSFVLYISTVRSGKTPKCSGTAKALLSPSPSYNGQNNAEINFNIKFMLHLHQRHQGPQSWNDNSLAPSRQEPASEWEPCCLSTLVPEDAKVRSRLPLGIWRWVFTSRFLVLKLHHKNADISQQFSLLK